VAAAESADNAVVPASFVPLFAIGIPGSVIAAILIGAFIIQGITPGPRMFVEQADLMYGIYASMLVASVFLLAIGYFGQRLFAQVVRVSPNYIIPVVIFLCGIGAYLQGGGIFGVMIMLGFGVFGFFAKRLDFSFVTFLIGFVIGPSFELSFRQALAITDNDIMQLANHPIAVAFIVFTVIAIWRIAVSKKKLAL